MDINTPKSSLIVTNPTHPLEIKAGLNIDNLKDILEVILQKGCKAIHWDYGEIWLPEIENGILRCSDIAYINPELHKSLTQFHSRSLDWTFALGEGLPGRIWQTQTAEWIESLDAIDPSCYQRLGLAQASGLEAILGLPLSLNGAVVAILIFYNRNQTPKNPSLLAMMESLTQLGFLMQRQLSNAALKQQEQRFQLLVENIWDYGIYWLDSQGIIQSWNPGAEKLKGYQAHEIIGHHYSDFFNLEDKAAGLPEQILETAKQSGRYEGEGIRRRKDGSEFCAHVVVTALRDEHQNLLGFTKITQDITQEHQAVAQLKQREAMYSSLFQHSNDGIVIHDLEGNILDANNRLLDLLGYDYERLLKKKLPTLHPPAALEDCHNAIETVKTQGAVKFETYFQRSDNTLIPTEVSASLVTVDDRTVVQGVVRDITDRKRNEALLRQQLDKETLLSKIANRIRQSLDLDVALQTTTQEVRNFLKIDRVLIYQFNPDWSGSVIVESISDSCDSILNEPIHDPCFGVSYAELYQSGRVSCVDDIYQANFKPCYLEFLEKLQVKASLIVPIIYQKTLWGLLVAHHCEAPRDWQDAEVEVLKQLLNQVAIAIHQAELYTQLQTELKMRERIEQDLRAGEHSIRTLYEITASPDLTFEQRLENLLKFGRHQFGLEIGQLSHIEADRYTIVAAQLTDEITTRGAILSLNQQCCQAVVTAGKTLCITQASQQGHWAEHPAHQAFGIESYLGTPVSVNGKVYGTLCFTSHKAHPTAFRSVDREILQLMAQWIGVSLERRQSAQALEEARDKALAGTQAKGEFLATMSHEIRTPMNAIIGMTGLLLDTPLDEQQQDFAETIRSSGEALLTIINDILDFSKIESGNLELEESEFSLRTCIEESLDLVVPQATRKKLELAYQILPDTPAVIRGDVTRLRQVLVNLLTNAVKFTHAGEIEVQVKADHDASSNSIAGKLCSLQFSVRDTGIGIPKDRMNRLFKPFSQVDASTTRKYGGTGLGLVICKQLAEAMGGQLWVDSEVNQGTTFYFTIQAEPINNPDLDLVSRSKSPLQGKRVLIVDDNATNRQILKAQTEAWGMQPILVSSGAEALSELAQSHQVDIAILDMQMPEMDGLELAERIHQLRDYVDFPLVMLTSVVGTDLKQTAMAQDFVAWLNKPVKHLQLFNVLTGIFGGSRISMTRSQSEIAQVDPELSHCHPLKILLAEDNAVNQKLAILLLDSIGYRIEVASNGLEVLEALERQMFDLVLMDVQMPEMDGLTASQAIRKQYTPCPRIIAVTANAMAGDREKYLAAGMDDYISKPIRVKELTRVLQETPLITVSTEENDAHSQAVHIPSGIDPELQPTPKGSQVHSSPPVAARSINNPTPARQSSTLVIETPASDTTLAQGGHAVVVEDSTRDQVTVPNSQTAPMPLSSIPSAEPSGYPSPQSLEVTAETSAGECGVSIETNFIKETLQALDGDVDAVIHLIELFLNESPKLLQQMSEAVEAGNLVETKNAGHTLKSSSAFVGAQTLSHQCEDLERESGRGQLTVEEIGQLVKAIAAEFNQVKATLQHHIKTGLSEI